MGPTWSQVGSKLAQVGVMLGPNWLQVGSSWAMLAPSWLPLKNPPSSDMPHPSSWPQVGSMLAPCWLMLAPCWLMLDQVASKMAPHGSKLAQFGFKMPLCWLRLASRWPTWPPTANFDQFLIKHCSFWNTLDPQNIQKNIGFEGPFAFCTFLFLLMVFEPLSCLKLAPSWLKLAYLSKFEPKLAPSWLQVGSSWVQVGPKLAPCWLMLGPCWGQVGSKLTQVDAMLVPIPWY